MNRRGFLGLLAGVAAGATLDPERLLWRPGAKLISVPKAQVVVTQWELAPFEFLGMKIITSAQMPKGTMLFFDKAKFTLVLHGLHA